MLLITLTLLLVPSLSAGPIFRSRSRTGTPVTTLAWLSQTFVPNPL